MYRYYPDRELNSEPSLNLRVLVLIMKEFIKALGKGHTYNIIRNGYVLFGILWGIPVPIVTIGMGSLLQRHAGFPA